MSTKAKKASRSVIIDHGGSRLRINKNDGKLFISMEKNGTKITMTLSIEESLVISSYLASFAEARLQNGLWMSARRTEGKTEKREKTTAPRQEEPEDVTEE
ncbi:hypothetical protein [Vulcanisaeta souniana]|uniref:Uncharacterized protein n=2 Tax=Vulcanisaeta souniana TaxID=164452 RepID=A0A830ECL7_9CREN|nr:hypothetical protein [Vulcanisaeta souniana]BDR92234.1 hypothetical protein Vsou_13270 [Vulcanisaeta souniana JCM 11219]GGI86080.1 hypothetical protein GCM10007112_23840 [Vulcanisaeta souniana JCM 11219]